MLLIRTADTKKFRTATIRRVSIFTASGPTRTLISIRTVSVQACRAFITTSLVVHTGKRLEQRVRSVGSVALPTAIFTGVTMRTAMLLVRTANSVLFGAAAERGLPSLAASVLTGAVLSSTVTVNVSLRGTSILVESQGVR